MQDRFPTHDFQCPLVQLPTPRLQTPRSLNPIPILTFDFFSSSTDFGVDHVVSSSTARSSPPDAVRRAAGLAAARRAGRRPRWRSCTSPPPRWCCAVLSASIVRFISATSPFSIAFFSSSIADSIGARSAGVSLSPRLLEHLLRGVGRLVGVVARLDLFLALPVVLGVRLRLPHHLVDLVLAEAARRGDLDLLLLRRRHVLGRHVDDAVGVDVEGDLDLRHAARRRRQARQVEASERAVVARHRALALHARALRRWSGCPPRSRTSRSCASESSCCAESASSSRRPSSRCRARAASRRAGAGP